MKPEEQAQKFAAKVMGMNRHERRKLAKEKGMLKIYGSNTPYKKTTNIR